MKVALTPAARRELVEGRAFYARQGGEQLAMSFVADVEHALAILRVHPRLGAPWLDRYRRLPLDHFPYNIVYRVTATETRILAVAHQSRGPGYWRDRIV